ncbi:MAG TPA: hypothetical protein VHJ17_09525 [Thermomonospora sp.]|nr:hypothetical protein [Thermomonospora sp.]
MLGAIESVDWAAIAGPADRYSPERVAGGMRDLASATSNLAAAKAASLLAGQGILHEHSGAVLPAAVAAAPLLLDIIEHGHPRARNAALGLLEDSLTYDPLNGYTRIDAVPLCCAIAGHIRARHDLLTGQGRDGGDLLAKAAEHWRFELRDLVVDDTDMIAFGVLGGVFPGGRHPAELHDAHRIIPLPAVALEYPPEDDSAEACLRLVDVPPDRVRTGAVLYSAVCGARVH